jgi:aspartyl-tRNA(Asn)/glutamyl-tRNA(Gln) amidotransferase subunit B
MTPPSIVGGWESIIGLEVHVQLKTATKMFCRCATGFGEPENTRTCPVCLAHPGALPVPNKTAVEWTVKLGLALGCEIADRAVFHRKNYFYFDNPKGYQISQYDEPLCLDGRFVVPAETGDLDVGIVRAHLEEDAAKTVHVGGAGGRIVGAGRSLVDFNRGGTPLVEIVTRPDLRSADEARRFLQLLRQTIVELGISDAEMEKGTLRCDANISVRPAGEEGYRTRWELKNMNSFTFIARGIDAAVREQIALHEAGEGVVQETYDYDADRDALTPHRTKEEAEDYRYFPEPDLVPVEPEAPLLERLRAELPEPPGARIRRLGDEVGLGTAFDLVAAGRDRLFEGTVAAGAEPRAAANVIMNQLAGAGVDPAAVDAEELAKLVAARDRIRRAAFDEAISHAGDPGFAAEPYLAKEQVSDTAALEPVISAVLAANPGRVEAYKNGKKGLLGFFVGQVMKESGGAANPKVVSELLEERLAG